MGAKGLCLSTNVKADDPRSYYQVAKRLHEETNNSIYINQYFNELNTLAHYKVLAKKSGTNQRRDYSFGSLQRTGGTISGTARYLKRTESEYSYNWR